MPKLSQILRTNTSIKWFVVNGDYAPRAGDGLIILASNQITLKASPSVGDMIQFTLLNGSEATINRNTKLINGGSENILVSKPSLIHTLIYTGAIKGWFYSSGDPDGIIEFAQNIAGTPAQKQYYGTPEDSTIKGFYDLPDIDREKIPLSSIKDINAIVIGINSL